MVNRNEIHTRQADLLPLEVVSECHITVCGVGAIGSSLVFTLAKSGFNNITVIDYDTVDTVNIGVQWFRLKDIGKHKVNALKSIVKDFTGTNLTTIKGRTPHDLPQRHTQIYVSCYDNMESRQELFTFLQDTKFKGLLVDGRMSSEKFLIYKCDFTNSKDLLSYSNTLHSDSEGVEERCTAKATMYNSTLIATLMTKLIKDYALKEKDNLINFVCAVIKDNNIKIVKNKVT